MSSLLICNCIIVLAGIPYYKKSVLLDFVYGTLASVAEMVAVIISLQVKTHFVYIL